MPFPLCRRRPAVSLLVMAILLAVGGAASAAPASASRHHARRHARAVTITIQGDSLQVGTDPYLDPAAHHWRVISSSEEVSRHVPEGIAGLQAQPLGRVILFALGTNDYDDSTSEFAGELREVMHIAGPHRCVVIPTIYAYGDRPAMNEAIEDIARQYGPRRVQVAQWAALVERGAVTLGDEVHPPDGAGYMVRAALIDRAIAACAAAR
jgi:hypothetical protein